MKLSAAQLYRLAGLHTVSSGGWLGVCQLNVELSVWAQTLMGRHISQVICS